MVLNKLVSTKKRGWGLIADLYEERLKGAALALFIVFLIYGLTYEEPVPPLCPPDTDYQEILQTYDSLLVDYSSSGSCNGIYRYYSGFSFSNDVSYMMGSTDHLVDPEPGNPISSSMQILPVSSSASFDISGIDCEDRTAWVYCLALMYPDVTCSTYFTHFHDTNHIGMECVDCSTGNCTKVRI